MVDGVDAGAMAQQARQRQLDSDAATLFNSRNQAVSAQDEANKAAFRAGELAGTNETTKGNIKKRLEGVKAALQHWQQTPPKSYSSTTPRVELTDPFRSVDNSNLTAETLGQAVHGTCLEIDPERGVARVASSCANFGCGDRFKAGDYPVLADGNVLDTAERVREFLKECGSLSVSSVRLENN
jgi:hypothetical protein